ncbi:hypothetical protein RJT34_25831 [Clitoria ternatea]|uniref:Uncharacterized protein n=1 Tax=Clitoria ternatea TaxID=43366 RepID=A0AAN9IJ49_CLITE
MSRCFPFPPPGYIRNGARSEALIESIKLREEIEKAEKDRKERKERKREKKERKKEKKERKHKDGTSKEKKEKKHKDGSSKEKKHKERTSHAAVGEDRKLFKHVEEVKEIKPNGKLQKSEDCENEQLERSGITEELDQPVSLEQCCLSDSTQSSKRKRSSLDSPQDHGPTIKIRLPLRKHREPEDSKPECEPLSSGIAAEIVGSDHNLQPLVKRRTNQVLGNSGSGLGKVMQNLDNGKSMQNRGTNPVFGNSDSRHSKAMQIFDDGKATQNRGTNQVLGNSDSRHSKAMQNLDHGKALQNRGTKQVFGNSDSRHCKVTQNLDHGKSVAKNSEIKDESQGVATLYESLCQISPVTCDGFDSLDQDWLFSSEPAEARPPVSKKPKLETDIFRCSKSLWPRAQYLPEVEVYALPYAVPF